MTAVALVTDLMDRSKIDAALPGVTFTSEPEACTDQVDLVVIDLSRHASDVAAVRRRAPGTRIVAFGRHDDVAALRRARADGADAVLSRSRFFQDPAAALRG